MNLYIKSAISLPDGAKNVFKSGMLDTSRWYGHQTFRELVNVVKHDLQEAIRFDDSKRRLRKGVCLK